MQIGVGDFYASDKIKSNVSEILTSGRVSYGKFTRQAEADWARMHNAKHAVAVSSGTAALHVAVLSLAQRYGWKPGAEIIVPSVTFVATLNVILHSGFKPVIVDVDGRDALMDPHNVKLAINKNTVAIMPVHLFGQAAPLAEIRDIADSCGLKMIEDSAEAVVARSGVYTVGSVGDFAGFSCYVAHHIPAGGGGFLTSNNTELADIARSIVNHGRDTRYFDPEKRKPGASEIQFKFHRAGLNYRSTEILSAVICGLMEDVYTIVDRRREIAGLYTDLLADLDGDGRIFLTSERRGNYHSWMMYPVMIEGIDVQQKYHLMEKLYSDGIDTRECLPLTNQPYLKEALGDRFDPDDYPVAKEWNESALYLPCHQYMTDEEVEYIALRLREHIYDL